LVDFEGCMKILEVYDANTENKWVRILEAKEGQKLTKKGNQLILDWEHDGQPVQTVYNLNLFPAYCIV
jgi:hypothetical protein